MFYLLSSPYLRVFGDDRVRGTREQMLLMQVALVKLSRGEGIAWGFYFMIDEYLFWIFIIDIQNKDLNFPRFEKWGIIKCDIIMYFLYLFINS